MSWETGFPTTCDNSGTIDIYAALRKFEYIDKDKASGIRMVLTILYCTNLWTTRTVAWKQEVFAYGR